ncbi:hypothetical protein [Actinocrispum sp. NPDC049592]|uniref:hypothetical protein n=1 Tax=Actinocrispum sp. NPDC049592 TaxID=3154835 RepID=UPI00342B34D0
MTVGQAEQIEIQSYVEFATSGPREPLGIRAVQAGRVHGLAIRSDPSNFFNRAGGCLLRRDGAAMVRLGFRPLYERVGWRRQAGSQVVDCVWTGTHVDREERMRWQ